MPTLTLCDFGFGLHEVVNGCAVEFGAWPGRQNDTLKNRTSSTCNKYARGFISMNVEKSNHLLLYSLFGTCHGHV